jgi:anaerobic magnesium-protoporphyrin IX monomethyl ester cyclase
MSNCDVLLIGYEEWENIGLRSIAAFLIKHGVKVKIEPYGSPRENTLESIRKQEPRIVGFSLIFQRMLFEFADLITYLRQHRVSAHLTMGGHFPSIEPRSTLESIPGLDSVVRGEGEQTLLELFQHLDQPDSWEQIKGLVYRRDGEIRMTSPRPLIQNLDSLPYIVRRDHVATHRGLGLCSILASRGCHYDCTFCSIQQFYSESPGPRRRTRSPSNVVQEMEQLFHERSIRLFIFEDDDLFMKGRAQQQWIENLVQELKAKKIADQILWRVSCRVDDIAAEPLGNMMQAGLMSVYLGIESGNNEGLKIYNKHYTVDDIYKALRILLDLGMPFEFGFMILNPNSTFATIKEDILFLKEIGKDGHAVVDFTKMIPYAGTPIARELEREGRLEGTLACPDYVYRDRRLELLQLFFTEAFHFRNFDDRGLAERLRLAKFDVSVVNKFLSHEHDAQSYAEAVRELIRRTNDLALEKMSLAVDFMEKRSGEEILDGWQFLELLAQEERDMEFHITALLDRLMTYYGFGASRPLEV